MLLLDPGLAVIGHRFGRGDRTDRLERVADLERIIDIVAVKVDAADAIDPEQFVGDDFAEDIVELVILGEPAMTADIELELAVFGYRV